MKFFIYYIIAINIMSFILFGIDKERARRGQWRIPERILMLTAILFGSIGSLVGMYFFRHKTKHVKFHIGIPIILIFQIIILYKLTK